MALTGKLNADFSDFTRAVQSAETQLVSFETGAGKVTRSLERMETSLSGKKLIQDATLTVQAIENIGGISKLTEAELQRLGAQASDAAEKMRAMGLAVPAGIQKVADAAKAANTATTSWLGDFGKQLVATGAGMVSATAAIGLLKEGWGALTTFVSDSVASYASAEAASKKMTTALQAQGTASAANIADFQALASQFQQTTVYSDDLINEMEALLTQIGGVAPSEMRKALSAATNLASGLGIDLRTATLLVAKASDENVAALKKAGVQLDETRVAGEGMEYILGKINDKFGGQAQGEIDTYRGKIKQLKNDWDNFKEAVGKSIVDDPLVIQTLKDVAEAIKGTSTAAGEGTGTISTFWAELVADENAKVLIQLLDFIIDDFARLDRQIKGMKPPDPKVFTDWGNDFKALNAEADKLVKDMIQGWVEEDKAAERTLAHEKKLMEERDEAFNRSAALQTKLIDEILNEQRRAGATANELKKIELDNQMAAEIAAVRQNKKATQEEVDNSIALIKVKYKGLADEIGFDYAAISASSMRSAQEQADNALKTYNAMVASGTAFRSDLDAQLEKYHQLRDAATAMGHAAVAAQDAAKTAAKKHNDELEKQLALNEALIRSRTSTFEVTSANLAQAITQSTFGTVLGSTGYNPGGAGQVPTAMALAAEGYSFAEILAILRGGPKGRPLGPPIPGFGPSASSGFTGGGSSATTTASPTFTGPNLGAPTAGSAWGVTPLSLGFVPLSINVNVSNSGVFDTSSARRIGDLVGDQIMAKLKMGRQLGAA